LQQKSIEKELNFNLFNNIIDDKKYSETDKIYRFDIESILENILIYGQYPHLVKNPNDEKYLLNFSDSLIFRDILELNLIENKKLAKDLLKLLAFQIGNVINYSELANSLDADQRVIKRYVEIFEQSFIIFRLFPYSKNKRKEIIKSPKIYFYDTGLRNALIKDFSGLNARIDKGALFENFIIVEILKQNNYLDQNYNLYYWRTKRGSEVDLVLEQKNEIIGVEIKYQKKTKSRAFSNRYPKAKTRFITARNFY
jgi:predicted AAA+ superfamily ATPase